MDNIEVYDPKLGPNHNVGSRLIVIPGILDSSSAVESEYPNLTRNHVGKPTLEYQVLIVADIIHIPCDKDTLGQLMLEAYA